LKLTYGSHHLDARLEYAALAIIAGASMVVEFSGWSGATRDSKAAQMTPTML